MLSATNVTFKATGKAKFMPRLMGPYNITEVFGPKDTEGKVAIVTACRVKLPDLMKIHPVFHVSLLKHYKSDGQNIPVQPLAFSEDGSPMWEVEHIMGEHIRKVYKKKVLEYLMHWKGFGAEQDTWENGEFIKADAPQVVDAWIGYGLRERRIAMENGRNKKRKANCVFLPTLSGASSFRRGGSVTVSGILPL